MPDKPSIVQIDLHFVFHVFVITINSELATGLFLQDHWIRTWLGLGLCMPLLRHGEMHAHITGKQHCNPPRNIAPFLIPVLYYTRLKRQTTATLISADTMEMTRVETLGSVGIATVCLSKACLVVSSPL